MMYDGVRNKPPLDELYHFNKNHDPNNGQFTSGSGISLSSSKQAKKLKRYQRTDKFQNEDGSLTEKGERTFRRLIDLNDEYEQNNKKLERETNDIVKYIKSKSDNKKKLSEYDMASKYQSLYKDDKTFKKMVDDRDKLFNYTKFELEEKIRKEHVKVANKDYDFLYRIGTDRVSTILDNYKKK